LRLRRQRQGRDHDGRGKSCETGKTHSNPRLAGGDDAGQPQCEVGDSGVEADPLCEEMRTNRPLIRVARIGRLPQVDRPLSYVFSEIGIDVKRRQALAGSVAALVAALAQRPAHAALVGAEVTVFAAASLQNALEAVARAHRARGGAPLRFSFAASSALARQIAQGAPASVFASADEQWMDWLAARELIDAGSRRSLLGNRLVLVVPAQRAASIDLKPGVDLNTLLGARGRWVTGDPASVPVGRYAQQALTRLGAWDSMQPKMVRAENVRVALAFVERGEAAAGIVYETDARQSARVHVAGVFPADSHEPISYPFAIVRRHDSPAARQFLDFAAGEEARALWRQAGFTPR
jgi:molybdate transport system substrate-binding protein